VICKNEALRQSAAVIPRLHRYPNSRKKRLATHRNFSCDRGQPCVFLTSECEEYEVVLVLIHETLHHALHRIGEEAANDALDVLMPNFDSTRLFLYPENWNPSWGL